MIFLISNTMRRVAILLFTCLITGILASGQVAITTDNSPPNSSAMLDVKSTAKGLLPPRMTYTQRNAISEPADGLVVFCTDCNPDGTGCLSLFMGGQWMNLSAGCSIPVTPAEGNHVQTNTQIIWNWGTVPISNGYKWNTSTNYATATDMGTATTKTQTGLTQGLNYTCYVWAYNACGSSPPVVLNGQALPCGSSFTKTHTAGNVAPVTKTVTYGTVTNIPGETAKCWITRNLGATQPPTTADDDTEASAGWYWQFNRKQGYKHTSTTRTPNTAWITTITEDSDWESANDPCSLLLGSAWRIPTKTEWVNVDAAGNWTNWNGPFNSGLQLHAAGLLYNNDGVLGLRGIDGDYWSSSQSDATNLGWVLIFTSSYSSTFETYKPYGFTARCVRDN
jgi:hypothetical protein